MSGRTDHLRQLDKAHLWHPFTQMKGWTESEYDPLIIASGSGVILTDTEGNSYLDGNSSIWTNIHGHGHPTINAAIKNQLDQIAHCSALGFSNEAAILLAEKLAGLFPENTLTKVFFSDNGSTAIECACKMAIQYRQLSGQGNRNSFIAFGGAYHGDTMGAASLGGIGVFQDRFSANGYHVHRIENPGELEALPPATLESVNGLIIEPLIQGAAGMRTWPAGMLKSLREWCDRHNIFLILDEVMTGFGRTGKMFACEHEEVIPDFLCLAKGLTGGYLPLAATLTSDRIYDAFLGEYEELKTFFYGHSYCANPLGCAAALGSLQVFEEKNVLESLPSKIETFASILREVVDRCPHFGELRQVGLIAGIDLVDARSGEALDWKAETGARVCRAARKHGLLTRPVRDTLTLMPPLAISENQISRAIDALEKATHDVLG
ncbi:MAG: adenosylmethionine--8-amino-7-oxononanoate transaminase [Verrucomicrobiales bacterium]|jgi:adenosylmethionine-8-amino-7-oxononanoate aminotransferase|nr:adenosylmethionine--8-amino-7-oxononanoate transaminase [bacterium]MDF2376979.1 adenosylmethionine--8-amino-7-oxononanoate transaminase [Verrucomicrobiales bacterium]